ncbi:SDR family oxidoreductase [Luteimicrobium subarcticum]|uniref:Uncharacterized protein YbjT (DUF2867 family) n=1 Tax=Luteimicrobium subarcticum TaxID=620910 RepID=A0A2M8WSA7_9MICO|nr:NAD(P)H-binding protein [Luteimicrobium subarcticum]PJI93764.1 uncharacterized protein YbjT (DUF2867 family) [Luteimicrobium subarcticum]
MTDETARTVAVVGATGQVGQVVVRDADARGLAVRGVSRSVPADDDPRRAAGATYSAVDVLGAAQEPTVAALATAFEGADAVVLATNATAGDLDVYRTGTRRVVEAAGRAGVRRLVVLSIANVDQGTDYPYYAAHAEQNEIALAGPVPATVVRATQFHTFLAYVRSVPPARTLTRLGLLPYPRGTRFQTIDVRDVARLLVDATSDDGPARAVDVGGPQVRDAKDLVHAERAARGSRRVPVGVRVPGPVGTFFREGRNLVPDHHEGRITFDEWLRSGDGV